MESPKRTLFAGGFPLPFFRRNKAKQPSPANIELAERKALVAEAHGYLSEARDVVYDHRDRPYFRDNGLVEVFEDRWSELYGDAPSGKKLLKGSLSPGEFRDRSRALLDDVHAAVEGRMAGRSKDSPSEPSHEIPPERVPSIKHSASVRREPSRRGDPAGDIPRAGGHERSGSLKVKEHHEPDPYHSSSRKASTRHRGERDDDRRKVAIEDIPEEPPRRRNADRSQRDPIEPIKVSTSGHSKYKDEDDSERRRRREERYREDKYGDDRYKEDRYGDRRKDDRYRDDRYRDDRYRDDKYKYRDDKYRDDKYRSYDRYGDDRYRDDKYRDDRYKEDRYRGDRRRDDRYRDEYRSKDDRRGDDRYYEDGRRRDRYRDDRYPDDRRGSDRRREDYRYDDDGRRDDRRREDRKKDKHRDERPREDRHRESDSRPPTPEGFPTDAAEHRSPPPVVMSPTYIPYPPGEAHYEERPRHQSTRSRHSVEDKGNQRGGSAVHSRNHSPSHVAGHDSGQQGSDQMAPLMIPPPRARANEPRSRFRENFSVYG